MKRLLWVLLPLLLVGLGLWLFGRAPTRYVLEQECKRYQEERTEEMTWIDVEIDRRGGDASDPEVVRLRGRREALLRGHKRVTLRGWEVLLLPATAPKPEPEDFLVVGTFKPASWHDPLGTRGPMEVWIRPRGRLARLIHGVGLD